MREELATELPTLFTAERPPERPLAPTFEISVSAQTYEQDAVITPLVLPAATGGNAPLTYSLSPEIPDLAFDAETRTLSGTPAAPDTYDMTYKAIDADGDEAELNFAIIVNEAVNKIPTFDTMVSAQTYVQNTIFRPLVLPEAMGGDGRADIQLVSVQMEWRIRSIPLLGPKV